MMIISIILFVIGISFAGLFHYSLIRPRTSAAKIFALICLSIAVYAFGYGLELRAGSVREICFFLRLEYFGAPFIFPFWLLFTYRFYFNRDPSIKYKLLIFIIPVLTLFFSETNDFHHYLYQQVTAVRYDGFIIAQLTKGPWYYVHVLYSYGLLLIGLVYFYMAWRNSLNKKRIQSMFLLLGTAAFGILEIFYYTGKSPYGMDLVPFAASTLALCYYVVLYRYDFVELDEVVRNVVFSEIGEGIIVLDDRNRLIDFNHAAHEVYSWLSSPNIGSNFTDFWEAREIINHKEEVFEIKVEHGDGPRYYEIRYNEMRGKNNRLGSVYLMRDITQQKKLFDELDNLASYDSVIDIYNRRRFLEEGEKEILRVKRVQGCLSFMMIDIDFFKDINDQYGHPAGDEVLRSIARVCKDRIRVTDILGRYGGDEICVLLPLSNLENTKSLAEQIRRQIEEMEISYDDQIIKVTVSIGVGTAWCKDQGGIDLNGLLSCADTALYQAKNTGRNCVYEAMEK